MAKADEDIMKELKRIGNLLEAITKASMREKLANIYQDKRHRLIYENTGSLPVKELSKRTGLGTGTISRLWNEWEQHGLLIKDGKSYRRILQTP